MSNIEQFKKLFGDGEGKYLIKLATGEKFKITDVSTCAQIRETYHDNRDCNCYYEVDDEDEYWSEECSCDITEYNHEVHFDDDYIEIDPEGDVVRNLMALGYRVGGVVTLLSKRRVG